MPGHAAARRHPGAHRQHAGRPRLAAFTLVELLIVTMVLGIVAGVAAPRFATALDRAELHAAARRLAADLRYARSQAISRGASLGYDFAPLTDAYRTLTAGGNVIYDPNHRTTLLQVNFTGTRVAMVDADFGGASELSFDFRGEPSAAGGVILQAGGQNASVAVTQAGLVEVTL